MESKMITQSRQHMGFFKTALGSLPEVGEEIIMPSSDEPTISALILELSSRNPSIVSETEDTIDSLIGELSKNPDIHFNEGRFTVSADQLLGLLSRASKIGITTTAVKIGEALVRKAQVDDFLMSAKDK